MLMGEFVNGLLRIIEKADARRASRLTEEGMQRVREASPMPGSDPDHKLSASFVAGLTPAERSAFEGGDSDSQIFAEAHGHRFTPHGERSKKRRWFGIR